MSSSASNSTPSSTSSSSPSLTTTECLSIRTSHLGSNMVTSYTASEHGPLHIDHGRDEFLYTTDGKKYLDAYNNVTHLGHSHPAIRDAATKQLDTINTNTRYLYNSLPTYVKELLSTFPDALNYSQGSALYLCNSGSEANDLALRIAAIMSGSRETIVIDYAYHGVTQAAMEASPYLLSGIAGEWYQGKADHIHIAEIPDTYRGRFRSAGERDEECGKKYAQSVIDHITSIQSKGKRVSAFLCESILGCAGQLTLPAGYISTVYQAVRAAGGVCIADEVQTGFGRCGKKMWAFETHLPKDGDASTITPDIVTLGKPMGNGFPIAGVVVTAQINARLKSTVEWFSSCGGSSLSCAVGLATLETIQKEKLQQRGLETGEYLLTLLRDLQKRYEYIGDVRGSGMFLGIELVYNRDSKQPIPAPDLSDFVVQTMKDTPVELEGYTKVNGVLLGTDGYSHNVIKFKSPMCFNKQDAVLLVKAMEIALKKIPENLKVPPGAASAASSTSTSTTTSNLPTTTTTNGTVTIDRADLYSKPAFTQLSSSQVKEILSYYITSSAEEYQSHRYLTGGLSNSNYEILTSSGRKLLCKVCNEKNQEELEREVRVLSTLRGIMNNGEKSKKVTIAYPVETKEKGKYIVELPFAIGTTATTHRLICYDYLSGSTPKAATPDIMHLLGRNLSALHLSTLNNNKFAEILGGKNLEPLGIHGYQAFLDELRQGTFDPALRKKHQVYLNQVLRIMNGLSDSIKKVHDEAESVAFPYSLCHGDIFLENFLVHDTSAASSSAPAASSSSSSPLSLELGLIDFEEEFYGPRLIDLCMAITGCCFNDTTNELQLELMQALLAGYRMNIELTESERSYLYDTLEYTLISISIWYFRHFHVKNTNETNTNRLESHLPPLEALTLLRKKFTDKTLFPTICKLV